MQNESKWFSAYLLNGGKIGFNVDHVTKLELQPQIMCKHTLVEIDPPLSRVQVGDSHYVMSYADGEKLMNIKENLSWN